MNTSLASRRATLALALSLCASAAASQIEQLPHPDTTSGNFFGAAVSIDGSRALVGASGENSCLRDGGAAYVFEQNEHTRRWSRVARLVASDCDERRFFGRSVALSGERALVASTNEEGMRSDPDVAYVFERDTSGTWLQTATLSTGYDYLDGATGTVVALEDDQALLTTWGDTSHGHYGGATYVFRYDASSKRWSDVIRLSGSGGINHGIFGGDASISGNKLVVPSSRYLENRPGSVYIFERSPNGDWNQTTRIDRIDDFFIAVDVDEDRLLVGESRAGSNNSGGAVLFSRDSVGVWQPSAELRPPTPFQHGAFGSEVALSGDRALVVGYDEQLRLDINIHRVVYVYAHDWISGSWGYQGIIDIGRVAFGSAIDLDGHLALIGAASEDAPGAAYIVQIP